MSGFVGELEVFMGVATSDIYSASFRIVTIVLAAVGLILTPIYLLSMLRQVFYSGEPPTCDMNDKSWKNAGDQEAVCFGTNCVLPDNAIYSDAKPRELFIAISFLILIVGIGVYPKLATNLYDVKTVAVNAHVRESYSQIAQTNPQIYASGFLTPSFAKAEAAPVLGVLK
jgi:NAD(P)H-quinone oxidoreductase subunit 4